MGEQLGDLPYDLYEVLGLQGDRQYSRTEIVAAYRKRALECHPDKCQSPDAHEEFLRVSKALSILSNEKSKEAYDYIRRCNIDKKRRAAAEAEAAAQRERQRQEAERQAAERRRLAEEEKLARLRRLADKENVNVTSSSSTSSPSMSSPSSTRSQPDIPQTSPPFWSRGHVTSPNSPSRHVTTAHVMEEQVRTFLGRQRLQNRNVTLPARPLSRNSTDSCGSQSSLEPPCTPLQKLTELLQTYVRMRSSPKDAVKESSAQTEDEKDQVFIHRTCHGEPFDLSGHNKAIAWAEDGIFLEISGEDNDAELVGNNGTLAVRGTGHKIKIDGNGWTVLIKGKDHQLFLTGRDGKLRIRGKRHKIQLRGDGGTVEVSGVNYDIEILADNVKCFTEHQNSGGGKCNYSNNGGRVRMTKPANPAAPGYHVTDGSTLV